VALASFAAAGIAGSNPMQTGFHSLRLGIAKYILPFVFVYAPGMVFVGNWHEIMFAIVGGFAGIYALTITTEGWCISKVGWPLRILMAICAVLFFAPGLKIAISGLNLSVPSWLTQIVAWLLLIGFMITHRAKNNMPAKEVPA